MQRIAEFGIMLKCALAFLVIALIAGIFGFTNDDIVTATTAQSVFGVSLLGFIIIVVVGFFLGSWTTRGPGP